jgi:hypothetical protein
MYSLMLFRNISSASASALITQIHTPHDFQYMTKRKAGKSEEVPNAESAFEGSSFENRRKRYTRKLRTIRAI